MREQIPAIRERGAQLVFVGSGSQAFARGFQSDFALDGPVLVDPELRAYRAAGLRRGRAEALSPRLAPSAARALRAGARQGSIQGDPWQLGGVFVFRPGGEMVYRHRSADAGDKPPIAAILASLDPAAPAVSEAREPTPALTRAVAGALAHVLDPLIVPSFDQTGFRLHAARFRDEDLDVDLAGRRCVITGANSGIGYEAALALADLGASVVLVCRSSERGEDAAERIRAATGNRSVSIEQADMADLSSVRALGSRLSAQPTDVLVHNAGLLPDERSVTPDGLELTFATHVVGPHLLTRLLVSSLAAAAPARVVWVSSGGMYTKRLQLRDPQWKEREYDGVAAYAETKRAQVVLAELWSKELAHLGVAVNAMHPGWADTPGVERSLPRFREWTRRILRTPAQGADTIVWLAAAERAAKAQGEFFLDREPRPTHLVPFTRETGADRAALWKRCQELSEPPGGVSSQT